MDKATEFVAQIVVQKRVLPFDLLKMAYNYSRFHKKFENDPYRYFEKMISTGNPIWIQMMIYSEDKRAAIEFVEHHFLEIPRYNGDCLLTLWHLDPPRALGWLKRIFSDDPHFTCLDLSRENQILFKPEWQDLITENQNVFEVIWTLEKKQSPEKVEIDPDILLSVYQLQDKYIKQHDDGQNRQKKQDQIKKILDQRKIHLRMKLLSDSQLEILFDNIWNAYMALPTKYIDFGGRDLSIFQEQFYRQGSGDYKEDLNTFLDLLKICPISRKDHIRHLFDVIPFWFDKYLGIAEKLFEWDPRYVLDQWKSLIIYDGQIQDTKKPKIRDVYQNIRRLDFISTRSIRPEPHELIYGLNRLKPELDMPFLISIMNHSTPEVREHVKNLMIEFQKNGVK